MRGNVGGWRHVWGGFTLIELMIVLAIIGILAAVAIPNFIKFQMRSRQAEVKDNLKAIFTAEHAYYHEFDSYTDRITTVGFDPERGNRYSYSLASGSYQSRSSSVAGIDTVPPSFTGIEADTFRYSTGGVYPVMPYAVSPVVVPGSLGSFAAAASGNIDRDYAYDQWSISSVSRVSGTSSDALTHCVAGNNPAGEPCADFDDAIH